MAVTVSIHVEGPDEHQVQGVTARFCEMFLAVGAEVTNRDPGGVEALIANVPVQLALEDATRLREILRTLEERLAPALAQEALEIIEAAIVLR